MSVLDDTAIFVAVVQQGGFSHAAKHLGLSNGLISRRITQLEGKLGVTLIKRTTRQLHLTPEGELFWEHAQRIQQELDSALTLIQSLSQKPTGHIRVSAPIYFGRRYLMPILAKFMNRFSEIEVDLILTNQRLDPIKEHLDLIIRGAGYVEKAELKDSTLKTKLLLSQKIHLYASPEYLLKNGEPKTAEDLPKHTIIGYADKLQLPEAVTWDYVCKHKNCSVTLKPKFNCNDMESCMIMCISGLGIAKFTELFVKQQIQGQQLRPILKQYDWGGFNIYAVYAQQKALPQRTRLLLDFISAHIENLTDKIVD